MSVRPLRIALTAAAAALAAAACGDSPTEFRTGTSWVLTSAAGRPLPAVVDSSRFGGYTYLSLVTAGGFAIISRDSAIYMRATEDVALDSTGLSQSSSECSSVPVAWRRVGNQVILHRDPVVLPPSHGGGVIPGLSDTLHVRGERLVRTMHVPSPDGDRPVELEYRPGNLPRAPCSPLPNTP